MHMIIRKEGKKKTKQTKTRKGEKDYLIEKRDKLDFKLIAVMVLEVIILSLGDTRIRWGKASFH